MDDDKTGRAPAAVDVGSVDLPMSGDFMANSLLYFGVTGDRESKVWILGMMCPQSSPAPNFVLGTMTFELRSSIFSVDDIRC